jgi:cytochrome P450 PksS
LRRIELLRPRIQEIADALIDPVTPVGEMELMSAYAYPLPITVIAEMVGVPRSERDRFRELTEEMFTAADGGRAAKEKFAAYARVLIVQRRREPGDDLLSALIAVEEGATSSLSRNCPA